MSHPFAQRPLEEISAAEVTRNMADFEADATTLNDALVDLAKEQPGQWAGCFQGNIFVAETQGKILAHFGKESQGSVACQRIPDPTSSVRQHH